MNNRYFIVGGLAILTFMLAFATIYIVREPDAPGAASERPSTPDQSATVEPNATPDTSQPGWHIPHVNEWDASDKFSGELNGFIIDPSATPVPALEVCATGLDQLPNAEAATAATSDGPLQVDPTRLPAGVTAGEAPMVWLCGQDIYQVAWSMGAAAGTDEVNTNGSPLFIHRVKGKVALSGGAPEDAWEIFQVGGQPAVGHDSIVSVGDAQFGSCRAAVYDAETDVMTVVTADAANLPFCKAVLEGVAK